MCSAGGQFDIFFNNVAIAGNGTVSTIYSPQPGATFTPIDASSWPGKATTRGPLPSRTAFAPTPDTHFYLSDQLGSTQMELAAGGWPLWQGEFTPFGQEIVAGQTVLPGSADATSMRFRFTGKERDTDQGWTTSGPGTTGRPWAGS